jgi:hypothetical protein
LLYPSDFTLFLLVISNVSGIIGMNVTIERILVLHSFCDEGFDLRLHQIANNPDLEAFQFEHCCVIDATRSSALIPEFYLQLDTRKDLFDILLKIVKEEVEPLLDRKIEHFQPDIIILHFGTIFTRAVEAFMGMISRLMTNYPQLRGRFALESKERWINDWFNEPERRRMLAHFRLQKAFGWNRPYPHSVAEWIQMNFISDPAIDEIVKAIFGPVR